jgi:formylglycine-generating enzyme required for sulfatase activity
MKKDEGTWEDAARQLDAYAWFNMNSGETTHPVGQKKPNPYGLYDVYGNVSEWVQDWNGQRPQDREITDYRGPANGTSRVLRGGGWNNSAKDCRSASSGGRMPADDTSRWPFEVVGNDFSSIGFRLALSPE